MSRRFTLIVLGTFAIVSAAIGYMAARAIHWHDRGWLGVYFINDPKSVPQAGMLSLSDGAVMITVAGSPADGRLLYRDEVLSINGIPRGDVTRLRKLDEVANRGTTVVFRVRRGGRIVDVPLRFESPLRSRIVILWNLVGLVVGLAFIGIAVLIIVRAPRDERANVFFALAVVSATTIFLNAATVYEQSQARGLVLTPAPALSKGMAISMLAAMFPPLILHLAMIFPRRRPILERRPILIRWIYAAAVVAVLMMGLGMMALLLSGDNDLASAEANERVDRFMDPIRVGYSVFSVAFLLYILFVARRGGVRAAIARRPFLSCIGLVGVLFSLAHALRPYVPREVIKALGITSLLLPLSMLAIFPVLAFVALIRSYRSANIEEKRQVAWPLFGLLVAIGGKILAFLVTAVVMGLLAMRHGDLIAWRGAFEVVNVAPIVLTLAIPISFAVAIFKYRLMNIDVIIRKTVVYAVLSVAIVVVYLGIVGGLGSFLVYSFGLENQTTMIIGSTLVVALLFVPVRNKLQFLVDRNLFRHKYDYPEALKAIATSARTSHDATEMLAAAAEQMQRALQNRAVVIFAERQDEFVAVAKVGVADSLIGRLRVPGTVIHALDRPFDPRRRTLDEQTAAALARVEASLVVPVGTRAFIAAAPKLSSGEFDVEDIDFFRSAAEQLADGIDRIRMHAEELDFEQASQIQQTLLPREMPNVAGLDVSGIWQPARTMGGDYYDLIELQETELAVCIGDVAGKGMPAALLMSGLQAAVRASASNSPRDLCERVRRVVVSSLSGGRFVTFFYATVDTATMKLRWCNAGHNAPILARADGTIVRLSEGGPAFSRLFRTAKYEEREIDVAKGDRLVLFTDGVSEAADASGEQFGESRIEELVTDCRDLGAEELQRTIVDSATSFSGGELEDDLTLVVLRLI